MPTKEREFLAQSPDLDARAEAKRRAVPALTNAYDRAAMGTLPAQRGGGMAGIATQGSGYRSDHAQADDSRSARKSIHRSAGCPPFHGIQRKAADDDPCFNQIARLLFRADI